jgi:hypothetical protein
MENGRATKQCSTICAVPQNSQRDEMCGNGCDGIHYACIIRKQCWHYRASFLKFQHGRMRNCYAFLWQTDHFVSFILIDYSSLQLLVKIIRCQRVDTLMCMWQENPLSSYNYKSVFKTKYLSSCVMTMHTASYIRGYGWWFEHFWSDTRQWNISIFIVCSGNCDVVEIEMFTRFQWRQSLISGPCRNRSMSVPVRCIYHVRYRNSSSSEKNSIRKYFDEDTCTTEHISYDHRTSKLI